MNTNFFHAATSARRKASAIDKLHDDQGIWHEERQEVCNIAFSYFTNLFSASDGAFDPVLDVVDSKLSAVNNGILLKPFTKEECRNALY